jgi:hypothetical protein
LRFFASGGASALLSMLRFFAGAAAFALRVPSTIILERFFGAAGGADAVADVPFTDIGYS